jgi:PAS domain S-box-containing protein
MKKILVIEDNVGVAELISDRLQDFGYLTHIAASGNEALQFLRKGDIDMVILDYSLPDMDGKEIISYAKTNEINMPPFIVSTGRGDEQLAVDMMKLGAYDYLIKDKTLINRLPEVVGKLEHEIERDTQLMKAQLALTQSEERFRNFVEKSSDFFLKISPEGYFTYVSPNWERHLGFSYADISSKTISKLIHKDDIKKLNEQIGLTSQKENSHFTADYRIQDKNGDWKYHTVKGYSVIEEGQLFINCIVRDITESKLAGKKLALAVFQAEEKEKKRFAEKLHEDIGPLISAIKMSLGRVKSLKNIDPKGISIIQYSDQLVDDAVNKVRNLANDLMPNIISDFGFIKAVRSLVNTTNERKCRPFSIQIQENIPEPDKMTSIILYRAVLKLTLKSSRHASEEPVFIDIHFQDEQIVITYLDTSMTVFTQLSNKESEMNVDMMNMKNRIEALNGTVSLQVLPEKGTIITIIAPRQS